VTAAATRAGCPLIFFARPSCGTLVVRKDRFVGPAGLTLIAILGIVGSRLLAQEPPTAGPATGSRHPDLARRSLVLDRPPRPEPFRPTQTTRPWVWEARQRLEQSRVLLQAAAGLTRTNWAAVRARARTGMEQAQVSTSAQTSPSYRRPLLTVFPAPPLTAALSLSPTATPAVAVPPLPARIANVARRRAQSRVVPGIAGSRYSEPKDEPRPSPFASAEEPAESGER
jgi:hypothetical protein